VNKSQVTLTEALRTRSPWQTETRVLELKHTEARNELSDLVCNRQRWRSNFTGQRAVGQRIRRRPSSSSSRRTCWGVEIEETDLLFIDTLHNYDQLA
jgi:hypothetical protein